MSRSIHTTRRTIGELVRKKFPSSEEKLTALKNAHEALQRKRRIKQQVRKARTQSKPPFAGAAVETIGIDVLHEDSHVHHGASTQDIRAVLDLLPSAATEGIARIQLSLGKEYREGFRHVHVLKSLEEIEAAVIERQPLWNNLKHEHGPFDIIGHVHGCFDELVELLRKLGYEVAAEVTRLTSEIGEGRQSLLTSAATGLTAQQQHDDLLDLADVTGKRIISTRLHGNVTIREENATAALEVMSRFAANPKWLIYLPPTMSPCETSQAPGLLEHPAEAFAYFRYQS
jgi:hypothetical protein